MSLVSGKCVRCDRDLTVYADHGEGDYECGGRMDSLVALITHGALITCPRCETGNVFKTDFLGGLYLEEYEQR